MAPSLMRSNSDLSHNSSRSSSSKSTRELKPARLFDLRIVTTPTLSSCDEDEAGSWYSSNSQKLLASLDKEPISPSCSVSTSSTASIRSFFSEPDTSPKKKFNAEPGFRSSHRKIVIHHDDDALSDNYNTNHSLLTDPWNQFLSHRDKTAPKRLSKIRWALDKNDEKSTNLFSTVKLRKTASSLLRQGSKSKKIAATLANETANSAPLPDAETAPAAQGQRRTAAPLVLKEPRYSPRHSYSVTRVPSTVCTRDSDEDAADRLHASSTAHLLKSVDNTLKAAAACSSKTSSSASRAHRRIRSKTMVATLQDSIENSMQLSDQYLQNEQYTRSMAHSMDAIQLLYQTGEMSPQHDTSVECLEQLRTTHHIYLCVLNSDKIIQMGQEQERLGRNFRAYKFYKTALNVRRDALGEHHASLSTILNILGALQIKRGHLRDASSLIQQALQLQQFHANSNSTAGANAASHDPTMLVQQAVTTRNMGIVQEAQKHFDVALEMYQISLRLHRMSRGLDLDDSESECGDSHACLNALLESIIISQQGQEGEEDDLQDLGIRQSMSSLLDIDEDDEDDEGELQNQGQADEGIECEGGTPSYSAAGLRQFRNEPLHPNNGTTATSKRALHEQEEGMEAIYEMAHHSSDYHIDLEHKVLAHSKDPDAHIKADIELAITLHMTGRLLSKHLHKPRAALEAYTNALAWMTQALGADHPNTAAILGNIANVHRLEHNYNEAFDLYQQVLKIETQTFGKWHTEVGVTLHNLGCIEYDRNNVQQAIKLFQKSMKIHKDVAGIDSHMVVISSTSIANVCDTVGDYSQAFMAYEVALGVTKMTAGNASLETASLYTKMGCLLQNHLPHIPTHLEDAEELYELALDIYQSSHHDFSEHHVLVKQANRALADIHAKLCLRSNAGLSTSSSTDIVTGNISANTESQHRRNSSPADQVPAEQVLDPYLPTPSFPC